MSKDQKSYDHKNIEPRWNALWVRDNIYKAHDLSDKPKKYILVEFPYPSGAGLHMGHFMRYTLPDIYSRKLRMTGFNVLFPMGWDAFGLPAENYAIKTGVHPAVTTEKAIENYTRSFKSAGFGIDWDRVVNTTDPAYMKWTQWIFLKFWEAGLAEIREEPIWWCEALRTVLSNEEVLDDGKGGKISERGEHPVERRKLKQWVLRITEYAEKLLEGLEMVDFPEYVRAAQRNWIGKSEGAQLTFSIEGGAESTVEVYTTRPDTIIGATFLVLAPEHPLVDELKGAVTNFEEVDSYREATKSRSDIERQASKTKTGVQLQGISARHPLTGDPLPVFIADYVLYGYGTGAIMAVPAHDERDFEFATLYKLPIVQTVWENEETKGELPLPSSEGVVEVVDALRPLFGNEKFVSCDAAKRGIISALEQKGTGERRVVYRLRDWVFSRQRYWGEPIPILHLEDGTLMAVARTDRPSEVELHLPLTLPEVPDYSPSSDGTSPLAKNSDWVSTTTPEGRPAKRETNTMPNWAGSSWYYLRYTDPRNDKALADPENLKYWLPVDRYFGGSEHTTLHLLYSRFWHKFLYDQGVVPTSEPYSWRMNGGILLGADGQKQSKSKGNVVDLNEMLDRYGGDALRSYICFLGPYDGTLAWNEGGLKACRKLVESIYELRKKVKEGVEEELFLTRLYHRTVQRVSSMMDNLKMNTVVSEFMVFAGEAKKAQAISMETWQGFVRLIAPVMVFLGEELWQELNGYSEWDPKRSVHLQEWPSFDPELAKEDVTIVGVQINGKLRGELEVTDDDTTDTVRDRALELPNVQKWLEGKEVKKFIYVTKKIISIVI